MPDNRRVTTKAEQPAEARRGCVAEMLTPANSRPGGSGENAALSPAYRLRPIAEDDLEFLLQLYASTRIAEKELVGWGEERWDAFMRMQFNLQHSQYQQNYRQPAFDVIMVGETPIGRLYLNRGEEEIRIVDIALLPEYRGGGIGAALLQEILREGDDRGVEVTLHVERNNPALALYRLLGFQVESATEIYCFMRRSPGRSAA